MFRINEIVWAKVKGFSWWPARVTSILTRNTYMVDFYGEKFRAKLHKSKLEKYKENINKYSNKNNRKLQEAIGEAGHDNYHNIKFYENAYEHLMIKSEEEPDPNQPEEKLFRHSTQISTERDEGDDKEDKDDKEDIDWDGKDEQGKEKRKYKKYCKIK